MIHKLSDVQSKNIGQGTKIWQFCVILPNARIDGDCNICNHCFIENNIFTGPDVTFCNDKYPKYGNKNFKIEKITIKKDPSIDANATLLPGITIGENAMIGDGSIVTKDIEANAVLASNPTSKFLGELNNIRVYPTENYYAEDMYCRQE